MAKLHICHLLLLCYVNYAHEQRESAFCVTKERMQRERERERETRAYSKKRGRQQEAEKENTQTVKIKIEIEEPDLCEICDTVEVPALRRSTRTLPERVSMMNNTDFRESDINT